MVVDDDIAMCETLSDILEGKGYQAVEQTKQNDFDLVQEALKEIELVLINLS